MTTGILGAWGPASARVASYGAQAVVFGLPAGAPEARRWVVPSDFKERFDNSIFCKRLFYATDMHAELLVHFD